MNLVLVCLIFCAICATIEATDIRKTVQSYFASDTVRSLRSIWDKERKAYEQAIEMSLTATYGVKGMNLYVRKKKDAHILSQGFYFTDNVVDVILKELYMLDLPKLRVPEVSVSLAENLVTVESLLSRMTVEASYVLCRNESAVVYMAKDLRETSPFSLQQVQKTGEITITADGCSISGSFITILSSQSLHLGHEAIKMENCKFNIEIWTPGLGTPPVLAPYFSKEQGEQLETLLLRPVKDELLPKLTAALYSYINTSVVFEDQLPKFRVFQDKMLKDTAAFMRRVVNHMNRLAVARSQGTLQLPDKMLAWNESVNPEARTTQLFITNVNVSGLDSAYSSHNGGPFKGDIMGINEGIRYSTLKVQGRFYNGSDITPDPFDVELLDVMVDVTIDLGASRRAQTPKCEVIGWRSLEMYHVSPKPAVSRPLLIGYILNELPKALNAHIYEIFEEALTSASTKRQKEKLMKDVPDAIESIRSDAENLNEQSTNNSPEDYVSFHQGKSAEENFFFEPKGPMFKKQSSEEETRNDAENVEMSPEVTTEKFRLAKSVVEDTDEYNDSNDKRKVKQVISNHFFGDRMFGKDMFLDLKTDVDELHEHQDVLQLGQSSHEEITLESSYERRNNRNNIQRRENNNIKRNKKYNSHIYKGPPVSENEIHSS